MGLHYEFNLKMYWNTDPFTPIHSVISSRMSKHRFDAISRALYLINPDIKSKKTAFDKAS
jgi:hypothetical protein